jgi:hypothetical protein
MAVDLNLVWREIGMSETYERASIDAQKFDGYGRRTRRDRRSLVPAPGEHDALVLGHLDDATRSESVTGHIHSPHTAGSKIDLRFGSLPRHPFVCIREVGKDLLGRDRHATFNDEVVCQLCLLFDQGNEAVQLFVPQPLKHRAQRPEGLAVGFVKTRSPATPNGNEPGIPEHP